jgi:hypothetical protein
VRRTAFDCIDALRDFIAMELWHLKIKAKVRR